MTQEESFIEEKALSVSICNHLFAILQGEYAKLKASESLQVDFPEHRRSPFELYDLEIHIAELIEWAQLAENGKTLFKKDWGENLKTIAAKKTFSLLDKSLQINLSDSEFASELESKFFDTKSDLVKTKLAMCLLAKKHYVRDNFGKFEHIVKGDLESIQIQQNVNLQILNDLILDFDNKYPFSDEIYQAIREELAWSERLFKVYANQSKIKKCLFRPPRYEDTIIPENQIPLWEKTGFPLIVASNWFCYNFSPEEALEWSSFGIQDPSIAWIWKYFDFDPATARDWIMAGYPVKQALELIKQGKGPATDN